MTRAIHKASQVITAFVELWRCRRLLQKVSIADLVEIFGGSPLQLCDLPIKLESCDRSPGLDAAMKRALRLFRPQPTCLVGALTLAKIRASEGYSSILLIGFRSGDNRKLLGHAWLAYPIRCMSKAEQDETDSHRVTASFIFPPRLSTKDATF